jgi:TusE/DsrC/DsvC family sulfur relay protein
MLAGITPGFKMRIDEGDLFAVNSDGYLERIDDWTKKWANHWARKLGFNDGANENHVELVKKVQKFYFSHERLPSFNRVRQLSGLSTSQIFDLFPNQPEKHISMMAGLPGPLTD